MLDDEHEIFGVNLSELDADKYREIHGLDRDCPIGLDDAPDICSAGTCSYCKKVIEE